MSVLRIPETLAISSLEREMLLCQDQAHLETEPVRIAAYGAFNAAATQARERYADWLVPSEPLEVDGEEVRVESLLMDTCSVAFNGKGRIGNHEIGIHAVRGLIGFRDGEPVRYDIVEEVFTGEGPRLVMNTSDAETVQVGLARNADYVSAVIDDWEEKRRRGLTDYPISARATTELTTVVTSGKPLTKEEFRRRQQRLFADPQYAARYYGFK